MRRRALISVCTAVAAVAVLAPDHARAAWGTDNQHQLVPAYFYPDSGSTPNNWTRMCGAMNGARGASTAVMNPNSGPGAKANSDYVQAIAACHAFGQHVIGYVYTSYAARALASVRSDIDSYFSFYPGIDGIFLDDMSNDPGTRAYYRSLYQYIRGKPQPHEIVGNPGAAAASAWQLSTPVADTVVVFEGTAEVYANWSPPSWVRSRVASTISNLVYATSDETMMRQVCLSSKAKNAGYMYVTNDVFPNPWDTLPAGAFWTNSVASCR